MAANSDQTFNVEYPVGTYSVPPNSEAVLDWEWSLQSTTLPKPDTDVFHTGRDGHLAAYAWHDSGTTEKTREERYSSTEKGVGEWWEVRFWNEYWIDSVWVMSRTKEGERLALTEVYVDD